MKITGYEIREAMKRWELRRNTSASQFPQALWIFNEDPEEANLDIAKVDKNFFEAEMAICELQLAQQFYNLQVKVQVEYADGHKQTYPLALAVKLIGPAGRSDRMWRNAVSEKKDRWNSGPEKVRDNDKSYARRAIPLSQAMEESDKASRFAMNLRQAVARANATELEFTEGNQTGITPANLEKLLRG